MITPLVAYADLHDDALVGALLDLATQPDDELLAAESARAALALEVSFAEAVARAVLESEGPFAVAARRGLKATDPRVGIARTELERLGVLAHGDAARILARHGLDGALSAQRGLEHPTATPPAAAALLQALVAAGDWGRHAESLVAFHAGEGIGELATHRVLRWLDGELVGTPDPDTTTLDDLVGNQNERAPLLEDLAAFAAGQPANDALLYGLPGTGKSAAVRACAAAFADSGVRLIQVERDQLDSLEDALLALRGEGPKTILFLDDLVVDDADRLDRALRATLDGGVAQRPSNVVVWATSNRLNLMHSSHSERSDDIDAAETVGEKAALAARFGRRIRFERQDREAYLAICQRLVRDRLGDVPATLDDDAMRFAVQGHGLSARTARQFADAYRP